MLIQSSLPTSIGMPPSFFSNFSEKKNSGTVSDWPNNGETVPQSLTCDVYLLDGNTNSAATKDCEKICASNSVPNKQTGSSVDLSANKGPCASSKPQSTLVFSRRKQRKGCTIGSSVLIPKCLSSAQHGKSLPGLQGKGEACNQVPPCNVMAFTCGQQQSSQKSDVIFSSPRNGPSVVEATSKSIFMNRGSIGVEASSDVKKAAIEHCVSGNDSCCSAKSFVEEHVSSMTKKGVADGGECSSSDFVAAELFRKVSVREVSLPTQPSASTKDIQGANVEDTNRSRTCKVCGSQDSGLNMLICDHCDEAFHLTCCSPRVRKITFDEWFCHTCVKKNPKPLMGITKKGKVTKFVKQMTEYKKKLRNGSGLIAEMLRDTKSYNSGARIGNGFQADVPEWSGPVSDDTDEFGEPTEIDPSNCADLNGWNSNQSSKPTLGNWIQCQEIIIQNTKDGPKEVVCGKWRRSPLYEFQTESWDCSCSLPWDPTYADCSVPQEIGTDEVMRHLQYVKLLQPQSPAKKRKRAKTKAKAKNKAKTKSETITRKVGSV